MNAISFSAVVHASFQRDRIDQLCFCLIPDIPCNDYGKEYIPHGVDTNR